MTPIDQTVELLNARCSTRSYAATPITADEKQAILHAAMRAPTAGNMMLYSIIEIDDQALKDTLAETCDDQPFIARAPWVLLFVADLQKWMDLFGAGRRRSTGGRAAQRHAGPRRPHARLLRRPHRRPERGDRGRVAGHRLVLCRRHPGARRDPRGAARLPRYTFPVTLLCLGRPKARPRIVERYEKHVVHRNRTAA